ncbi:MAG: homoserine O-acetyltransferase [Balneolia bacterium]|nr:homoserine O-acetyltransferase [Balneolia bacterium]
MQPIADSVYNHLLGFVTEAGKRLPQLDIAWKSWGKLSPERDNVILICHALTGHADAGEWFSGLFKGDGIINLNEHFVLCMNVPGSCYGSTGPQSVNPETGRRYGADFPVFSIRDMVRAQQLVLDHMGVNEIQLVIGGSMGGMQALEFAYMDDRVKAAAVVAAPGRHEAWAVGISEAQRLTIKADARWNGGNYEPANGPVDGIKAARAMAMLTYRAHAQYNERFGRDQREDGLPQVASYLQYQGDKLAGRFDALTYIRLTEAMDTHDIGRGRGGFEEALTNIDVPVLVVGIDSDLLYPPVEQHKLASLLPKGSYRELKSAYGHDGFLIEFEKLNSILKNWTDQLPQSFFSKRIAV